MTNKSNMNTSNFGIISKVESKCKSTNIGINSIDPVERFIITIDDLSLNHYIHRNVLVCLLKHHRNIIENLGDKEYIRLIKYPDITRIIFEYIFNTQVYCYELQDIPTNLVVFATPENIEYIMDTCQKLKFDYNIYSNRPINDAKRVRLQDIGDTNPNKNKDYKTNLLTPNIFIEDNHKLDNSLPRARVNFNSKNCYVRTYKVKRFINFNMTNCSLNKKLKIIKSWFRFKWYQLLLPIYIFNNINMKYMFQYMMNNIRKLIKINITKKNLLDLHLHPIQLVGSTIMILFRRRYDAKEHIINDPNSVSNNSIINWCYYKSNTNIYSIILQNIAFDYAYNGKCFLYEYLRCPLIYLNDDVLTTMAFPYNLSDLNIIWGNMDPNTREYVLQAAIRNPFWFANSKQLNIEKFIQVIN